MSDKPTEMDDITYFNKKLDDAIERKDKTSIIRITNQLRSLKEAFVIYKEVRHGKKA